MKESKSVKIKKVLWKILWWTWCLPQMIMSLYLLTFCKLKKIVIITNEINGRKYIYTKLKSGSVSLGRCIFLCESHWENDRVKLHEFGHTQQSLILGWLYLLVIGIPSMIWASCFSKYRVKHNVSYYSFYTEKWANKLVNLDIK